MTHEPFCGTFVKLPWLICWTNSVNCTAGLPTTYSESALVHAHAVFLFSQPGMEDALRFELRHKEIVLDF